MGVVDWWRKAFGSSPKQLASVAPVVREKPLYEQFQRIGGNLTPVQVSQIVREADAGYPARLVDLGNESRQKDGHMQSVLGTRDGAVSACEVDFVVPERANQRKLKRDKRAVELCQRTVDDFENWPTLVEHLTGSYFPGHATATLAWRKTKDGFLLPYRANPLFPRNFVFSQSNGELRYSDRPGLEVDLLAENPGRVVQLQRRIVGDVPAREGLLRLMVWSALFRNWTLTDWIALGEVGWKPWRIGEYEPGTHQDEIDRLVDTLETIGSNGVGAIPSNTKLKVEWPKGNQSSSRSTHAELFETLGREMSKAVLGQTTSVEAGPNGDRASTQTRDNIRLDKREQDAVAVAAALKAHLFAYVVMVNLGDDVLVPTPWFQTDEATDQVAFATAVEKLVKTRMRVPAKWVRDEVGMPEPKEGEEIIGIDVPADAEEPTDPEEPDGDEEDGSEEESTDDAEGSEETD